MEVTFSRVKISSLLRKDHLAKLKFDGKGFLTCYVVIAAYIIMKRIASSDKIGKSKNNWFL